MRNLNELKDLINLELSSNGCVSVHEIKVVDPGDNLYVLIMCGFQVDLETLKIISNWSGDPNPAVFQAPKGLYGSNYYPFEVMIEWFNEDIPY